MQAKVMINYRIVSHMAKEARAACSGLQGATIDGNAARAPNLNHQSSKNKVIIHFVEKCRGTALRLPLYEVNNYKISLIGAGVEASAGQK
jgi:hypothetical protein